MKKKTFWILTTVVILITAVVLGVILYKRYVPKADVEAYNTYANARAYGSSKIGNRDILVLHSVTKAPGGDTKAEFYIYRLPDGVNGMTYLDKMTSQIGSELEQIGTASCTFIGGDPTAVYNLSTMFIR